MTIYQTTVEQKKKKPFFVLIFYEAYSLHPAVSVLYQTGLLSSVVSALVWTQGERNTQSALNCVCKG